MKRFFIPQKLSHFLMVLLIPAVLFSFVSCGKGGSSGDGDDHSEGHPWVKQYQKRNEEAV